MREGLGKHAILAPPRTIYVGPSSAGSSVCDDVRLHTYLLGGLERDGEEIRDDQQASVSRDYDALKIKPSPVLL